MTRWRSAIPPMVQAQRGVEGVTVHDELLVTGGGLKDSKRVREWFEEVMGIKGKAGRIMLQVDRVLQVAGYTRPRQAPAWARARLTWRWVRVGARVGAAGR